MSNEQPARDGTDALFEQFVTNDGQPAQGMTDALFELLDSYGRQPAQQQLRVAEPVWRFLRDKYCTVLREDVAQAILGLPIIVDDQLTGGQWQLHEDGQVSKSGDMAPSPDGHMVVNYSPIVGWIALAPELAASMYEEPR